MRSVLLVVSILALSLSGLASPLKAQSISGSFTLNQINPVAGQPISFTVDVANLPTNGGATISPFVELTCGSVYEALEGAISPVTSGTSNPTLAYFTLLSPDWAAAGLNGQPCEAYLFYDGWNNPRRRKTNTLAALFFTVGAGS